MLHRSSGLEAREKLSPMDTEAEKVRAGLHSGRLAKADRKVKSSQGISASRHRLRRPFSSLNSSVQDIVTERALARLAVGARGHNGVIGIGPTTGQPTTRTAVIIPVRWNSLDRMSKIETAFFDTVTVRYVIIVISRRSHRARLRRGG